MQMRYSKDDDEDGGGDDGGNGGNGSDAGGDDGGADGRKMVGVGVMVYIHDIVFPPPDLLPNLLILLHPLGG